jgi:hypothetical protein
MYELKDKFPNIKNFSLSTICRGLRHDLHLTKKKLTKLAREAKPEELQSFHKRLHPFYKYPEQLVFVDETSKDGRAAMRSKAWAPRGQPAVVRVPFTRGKRVSVLAAFGSTGFLGWSLTDETFTRARFHQAFKETILPKLNPWPLPHSIVVMDNARIHMYPELEQLIAKAGAILFYLPPYSPELNPIELGFSLIKRWIQKNAPLAFHQDPEATIDAAFRFATEATESVSINMITHCGYTRCGLDDRLLADSANENLDGGF